jgi:hypothetical protein
VKVTVTAAEKRPEKHVVVFDCHSVNQKGDEVITGSAQVIAPTEKVRRPRVALPEVQIRRHDRYGELIKQCADLEPIRTAVVHPCDRASLEVAIRAAGRGSSSQYSSAPKTGSERSQRPKGSIFSGAKSLPPSIARPRLLRR